MGHSHWQTVITEEMLAHWFCVELNMASYTDADATAIQKLGGLTLKDGEILALKSLLKGKDIFSVLPTGYGKSLIYQWFVHVKLEIAGSSSIIVISALKSIVQEQLKSNKFELKVVKLSRRRLRWLSRRHSSK